MKSLFIILLLMVVVGIGQAAPGYEIVQIAPEPGMYPLGTVFTVNALNVATNTWQAYTARIDGYVVWINPPRPPHYYVTFVGETNVWFIWNRETINQYVPAYGQPAFKAG